MLKASYFNIFVYQRYYEKRNQTKSIAMEESDLRGINLYERIKLEFNGD
jgi:hypothetical protein